MSKTVLLLTVSIFCTILNTFAQDKIFQPLQLDLNFVGIGVKTTYRPSPNTELDAGLGYGLSIVLSENRQQYVRPLSTSEPTDIWSPDLNYGPYVKLGFLYKFTTSKNRKPSNLYTKLQYMGWLPATHLTQQEETKLSYQHRLSLKAGYRKALNTRQTWSINFEAGAALWANHNLSFVSAGPQFNLNFIGDLFTIR